jgi:hypothetical protein
VEFFEYLPSEVNSTMVPRDYLPVGGIGANPALKRAASSRRLPCWITRRSIF